MAELLQSIKAQSYWNMETIFIVENSMELLKWLKQYVTKNNVPNIHIVFNYGEEGLSAARNLGIKKAKGEILAFVDDDVILFPEWAEQMVKAYMQNNSVIGVTGPAFPLWDNESMQWLPKEFYWLVSCTSWCNWTEVREVRNAWGMNMSFKKDAFDLCGHFATTTGGDFRSGPSSMPSLSGLAEDNEFSMRVKIKTKRRIIYNPNVRVWHRVHNDRLRWKYIIRRSYHIGQENRIMKNLYAQYLKSEDLLCTERSLMKRIFTDFPMKSIKNIPYSRLSILRQLLLAIVVLLSIGLGYTLSSIPREALALKP